MVLLLAASATALGAALLRCSSGGPLADSLPGGWWTVGAVLGAAAFALAGGASWLGGKSQLRNRFGQYIMKERIGSGGMGEVYLAEHRFLRRVTAVKVLRKDKLSDRNMARFDREVRITAGLNHPNTVTLFDFGHASDGTFYYAMEYVPGLTLHDLVERDGPMPPGRIVRLLSQVAGALAEAHSKSLVHRDLKPSNIMVARWGGIPDFVKVLDFGLARDLADDNSNLTRSRALVGTPSFMAPEAILDPRSVDARADVYGLGALGYFLRTGTAVADADRTREVLRRQIEDAPQFPPGETDPAVAELDALLAECLAKTREARPGSARKVAARLVGLVDLLPWSEEDSSAWWDGYQASPVTPGEASV